MIARFLHPSDLSGRNQDRTPLLRLIDSAGQWVYLTSTFTLKKLRLDLHILKSLA